METVVSREREVSALTMENGWKKCLHMLKMFLQG